MKNLIWPETAYDLISYTCANCYGTVDVEPNSDGEHKWWTPKSRYWDVSLKEVYHSAYCAFAMRQRRSEIWN